MKLLVQPEVPKLLLALDMFTSFYTGLLCSDKYLGVQTWQIIFKSSNISDRILFTYWNIPRSSELPVMISFYFDAGPQNW